MRIWVMRVGEAGEADDVFLVHRQVALRFGPIGDASSLSASRAAICARIAAANPDLRPRAVPIWAGQLYRFIHEMTAGDRVIYPRKVDRTLRWGRVTGGYVFGGPPCADYDHRRSVEWIGRSARDDFPEDALGAIGPPLSFFALRRSAEAFLAVFEPAELRGTGGSEDGLDIDRR